MYPVTHPIPAPLRTSLETFFQHDLSAILIHVGAEPALVGAVAYTLGNHIFIHPDAYDPKTRKGLEIIGHEVAHVLQQRAGRVHPTDTIGGMPLNADPALEREADALSKAWVRGLPPPCATALPLPANETVIPVVQRLVTLAGKPLKSIKDLSPEAQLILSFIHFGSDWLEFVIADPHVTLTVPDESQLLSQIVFSLSGQDLIFIPSVQLLAHPAKLLTLSESELQLIQAYSPNNIPIVKEVSKILAEKRLRNMIVLAEVDNWLVLLKIPPWWPMSLSDKIRLFDVINGANTPAYFQTEIQHEAAGYAITFASSWREFVNLFQFYMEVVNKHLKQDQDDKARRQRVEATYVRIWPFCVPFVCGIGCPIINPFISDGNLFIEVSQLAGSGKLYFGSLSSILYHLVKHTTLDEQQGDEIKPIVEEYMKSARDCIATPQRVIADLSQDGQVRSLTFERDQDKAVVLVYLRTGTVILATYFKKT